MGLFGIDGDQLDRIAKQLEMMQEQGVFDAVRQAARAFPIETIDLLRKTMDDSYRVMIDQAAAQLDAALYEIRRLDAHIQQQIQSIPALDLLAEWDKRYQREKEIIDAFEEARWPISPSMPDQLKSRVLELYQQQKSDSAQQVIMGYYRRGNNMHLENMVDKWGDNDLFLPRLPLIRRALQAHCEKDYLLSIPALYPQVEGIFNEIIFSIQPEKVGSTNSVYSAVIGEPLDYDFYVWPIMAGLINVLKEDTYGQSDFEVELAKPMKNRRVTRHTVLHGVAVNYNRANTSLKLLLILDAMSIL